MTLKYACSWKRCVIEEKVRKENYITFPELQEQVEKLTNLLNAEFEPRASNLLSKIKNKIVPHK